MPAEAGPASVIVCCVVNPSGAIQPDVTVVRPEHRDLVLDHLGAVLVDQPAEEDRVRPARLDLPEQRLVARRLRVPRLEADDLDAEMLRGLPRGRRDAEAVGLLVVQDVELRDALAPS